MSERPASDPSTSCDRRPPASALPRPRAAPPAVRELEAGGELDVRYRRLGERSEAILVHLEGRFVYANEAAVRLLRCEDASGIVGRTPFDFVEPEFHDLVRERIRRVMEEEVPTANIEYRWKRTDGSPVDVEVVAGPVRWTGHPGVLVVARDITRRKRAEAALRAAKRAAEQASEAKSQFLAVMSHELRTPLSAVIGCAHLLEEEILGDLNEKQKESMARIRAGSWHLLGIIEQILTFSRAEADREEVRREETDVAAVAAEVVEMLRPRAEAAGLRLEDEGEFGPGRIVTDPGKVRQILMNLVDNAIKYTPRGSVGIRLRRTGSTVRIEVWDTGPGIPPHEHERIFEPFTQMADSYTRTQSGTGLGLAISRRLARVLGGEVALRSVPGEGSTFTLRLPG